MLRRVYTETCWSHGTGTELAVKTPRQSLATEWAESFHLYTVSE